MNEKIAVILDGLKINDGEYKRDLIDQAVELKDDIAPYLIQILENALSDPKKFTEDYDRFDHNYALMLLGHFHEPKAHNVIVELFSLPDEIPYNLFGDTVTEELPALLVNTCGGSIDLIKSLVLNKNACEFCRCSAANALTYAVIDEVASRKEILDFLGELFTGNEADPGSEFWSFVSTSILDLYPEDLIPTIEKAYEDGLIHSGVVSYKSFKKALKKGKEECLEKLRMVKIQWSLDDIHKAMSWWACFIQEEPDDIFEEFDEPNEFYSDPYDFDESSKPSIYNDAKIIKKKKSKKKKKRKLAKKSRRKNR